MVREARKRKVILWPMLVAATSFAVAVPVHARDMMGVIDDAEKEIIPCKYKLVQSIGCGFYFATGFEDGPGVRQNFRSPAFLYTLPEQAREQIMRYRIWPPKILFNNDGKEVKLPIPKGTLLADVYISQAELMRWRDFEHDPPKPNLPADSLIEFVGAQGFGVCDLNGNVLIEPKYHILFLSDCAGGKISVSMWSESKKKFEKDNIPIAARFTRIKDVRPDLMEQSLSVQKPSEGMLIFRDNTGKFGYKDEHGQVVISAQYYSASTFSEGVAAVRLNPWQGPEVGKHCFINKTGKIVSPIFWRATGFHGKFAAVTMKGTPTEIPSAMLPSRVLKERNPLAYESRLKSLAQMYTRNSTGLINREFNYILPLAERNIEYSNQGFWIITESQNPARVLDLEGKLILETPEPANHEHSEDALVFSSSHAGAKKLFFYDKSGHLQKVVNGEIRRPVSDASIAHVGGTGARVIHVSGSGSDTVDAIIDKAGNMLVKPKNTCLQRSGEDRAIKTVFGKTFVREDWMRPNTDRAREFQLFLKEHKLVGMKRGELEKILGPSQSNVSNQIVYTISGFGSWCGNAYTSVKIELDGDKVIRWRYSNFGGNKGDGWNE